ncbi:bifunctional [glutamine synthetase] adenylyltransferase/[glutamine synthetase]-adenylyl-L-tyrosine phosphorylase [Terasakiella sp. A23]|uniref:bifunctional [glutamine synthetase] adenylyltransferase/[glutamine synthetase]-adenylyl-L-tyrosine phosphorylase n=1 Tax=Terasakiella sp. FCG-A23 TaxID=3080561 RepID=UPI0029538751|nr:bifunctional [glutamine synthetase] adenylyltransferase/[glutamine synthetase]-adenylyl-L-tyrosine phosphorylase [Terasakiella sp. A23]MDV7339420.1 bifunctional [glutamine synthetase] adenylyltransferase/[glutamine synthetase]-adenylyl-L-tyrosine phosphorylase [Terasakiella sp. A23]
MTTLWYQNVNVPLPIPSDQEKCDVNFSHWQDATGRIDDTDQQAFATTVIDDMQAREVLSAIFGNSPFLSHCITSDISFTCDLLKAGPDATLLTLMDKLEACWKDQPDRAEMAKQLRITKRRAALTIALADICQTWDVFQVTEALTTLAEKSLDYSIGTLLREGHNRGYFKLPDPENNPQKGSGFIILGMGKLGGRELNYSSDVDIIVLYDADVIETDDPWDLQANMVRITKQLVQMMDDRTSDGYVFRTDLRLRPDPGSTPLAISVLGAETYYESIGQNWERAAMIKARPVAGDIEAGYAFLETLRPYMWRKYMDFAAIQDIHAIKRQINAHKGGHSIALNGHNVKLGHGGIREIEFYAQTQQLIWGGRNPDVRIAPTCKALQALVNAEQVDQKICDDLIESYQYLRTVEHRIQMTNDEQSHSIPEDDEAVENLATFLGYANKDAFAGEFIPHLERVETYYAQLFEDSTDVNTHEQETGNLVFTGAEVDPGTIKYLESLGFNDPQFVDTTVRGWHHARYRATRSRRSREILTELMPVLIHAMANTAEPDTAFKRFDEFLSQLPAGVQLFSMFQVNPQLLDLVAEVMGEAPRLAEHLARHSGMLEYVLTPDFFTPLPDVEELCEDLEKILGQARDFQDILDISRRWANDRKFQVGVQTLRQIISIKDSGLAQTHIADALIRTILPRVMDELAQKHGIIEGGDMCIVGLGKAGSCDMTATSDLDLVFIYDVPEDCLGSNGDRELGVAQYYARLSQRFINALSAPTGEGMLYEVDMRLRPSGNAGPIASSMEAFIRYHDESAWTWEHMALTRARVICGGEGLTKKVETEIKKVLCTKRDTDQLVFDVSDMRKRMDKEHHTDVVWEIKQFRGGIVDIDFMAQYLQLNHAAAHPEILQNNTVNVLQKARELEIIDESVASDLISAIELWNIIQGYLRLTVAAELKKEDGGELPHALKQDLVQATGEPTFDMLCERMKSAAKQVMTHYNSLIDEPASLVPPKDENA